MCSFCDRLEAIENEIREIKTLLTSERGDKKFTIEQAAEYLNVSVSRLYKLTMKREIPFHKPGGKKLYFFQSEIDGYIRNGKVKTQEQLEQEATTFLTRKGRK